MKLIGRHKKNFPTVLNNHLFYFVSKVKGLCGVWGEFFQFYAYFLPYACCMKGTSILLLTMCTTHSAHFVDLYLNWWNLSTSLRLKGTKRNDWWWQMCKSVYVEWKLCYKCKCLKTSLNILLLKRSTCRRLKETLVSVSEIEKCS